MTSYGGDVKVLAGRYEAALQALRSAHALSPDAADLEKLDQENTRDRGLARTREAGQEDREALLVAWGVGAA